MVANKSELSLRAAIMSCLARCSESQAPLCCLGEFLEKLIEMGWSRDDVHSVQTSVLRLLNRATRPQSPDASHAALAAPMRN